MYKIDSQKAEEFICHEEILDTLEYAQSKSQDKELIRSIIEKARLCKGLSHREAAVLLECNDPELVEEIYRLAREIKQKFYGNRIVMFAPLYLSNYCVLVKLLRKQLYLLSLPRKEQDHCPQETDTGRHPS